MPDIMLKNETTGEIRSISVYMDEVVQWRAIIEQVCAVQDCIDVDRVRQVIEWQLKRLGFGYDIIGPVDGEQSVATMSSRLDVNSRDALIRLLWGEDTLGDVLLSDFFSAGDPSHPPRVLFLEGQSGPDGKETLPYVQSTLHADVRAEREVPSSEADAALPHLISKGVLAHKMAHQVIVYQTRGVTTGGTIALVDLHSHLKRLGYRTLLCDDHNQDALTCVDPPHSAIVVSGEWCHEVLADYGLISGFRGRGVQYHLGHHHMRDTCVGSATAAVSHYFLSSLSHRSFGAYYLGCGMKDGVRARATALLMGAKESKEGVLDLAPVQKERLIVLDNDFLRDYPPTIRPNLTEANIAPSGWRMVQATGFEAGEFAVLLERAAVVVDLGMPGAERLAYEGSLLGAVAVVSSLWNGASYVDYPGAFRVDPLNEASIKWGVVEACRVALRRYGVDEAALSAAEAPPAPSHPVPPPDPGALSRYALSMQRRAHHTVDAIFGSSALHFVLSAPTTALEDLACVQLAALLYLHPLASIDIYVRDEGWFLRHHYAFWTALQQAGMARYDPFDPLDNAAWRSERQSGQFDPSFVRILPLQTLDDALNGADLASMVPYWRPALVALAPGVLSNDPFGTMHAAAQTEALRLERVPRGETWPACGNAAQLALRQAYGTADAGVATSPLSMGGVVVPAGTEFIPDQHTSIVRDLCTVLGRTHCGEDFEESQQPLQEVEVEVDGPSVGGSSEPTACHNRDVGFGVDVHLDEVTFTNACAVVAVEQVGPLLATVGRSTLLATTLLHMRKTGEIDRTCPGLKHLA